MNPNDQKVRRKATTNAINVKRTAAWFLRLKAVLLEKARWRKQLKGPLVIQSEEASLSSSRQTDGQRFIVMPRSKTLTVDDLSEAEAAVIRYCQQKQFEEEIAALSSKKTVQYTGWTRSWLMDY